MSPMELWDILNENGEVTGQTLQRGQRSLVDGEYHLVVHIWIVNDKNEFLIQQRAWEVEIMPGKWAITSGSATKGEDSVTAALRELEEEMGIKVNKEDLKLMLRKKGRNDFVDVWLLKSNVLVSDIVMQKEEVQAVQWIDRQKLLKLMKEGKFHRYFYIFEFLNLIKE